MSRSSYRLAVIQNHINVNTQSCSVETRESHNATSPSITVSSTFGMVDDIVRIQLNGFQPGENVTLVARLLENRVQFESRCVYKIDDNGCADNFSSASSGGTFIGISFDTGNFCFVKCISCHATLIINFIMQLDLKTFRTVYETIMIIIHFQLKHLSQKSFILCSQYSELKT